ncbi:60S acidic ribosomal protein P1 [Sarcoptes scabiei]|uniref:Large ribosomal subunit protein P1 n=1 Tax=Sarcoptes scabiei TaxID=52283 RepID=A0A132AJ25_SARSC|nr:60S acidic ribosomal protein P1 [Sarcoptes scabiei]KPM10917.1 60S acidic ribosomal protein P1-like protein [Sarcoptes scabiei]UXI20026.1 Clathrin interactor 1 [Sarcoptes scabiei]
MSSSELACVYSSLILQDDDVPVTAEKIQTILKAANVDVEPYWAGLFAKALESVDVKALITTIGSGVGSGPAVGGGAPVAAAAAAPAEEAKGGGDKKKEKEAEPESEEDDDMGFGLFD